MVQWYDAMRKNPKAEELYNQMIIDLADGKNVKIGPFVDMVFVPTSEEHEQHKAVFAGVINPGEKLNPPFGPAEQRSATSYAVFRTICQRAKELRAARLEVGFCVRKAPD